MKQILILSGIFFLSFKGRCSDTLYVRATVVCDLSSPFYDCNRNHFAKIIDTSLIKEHGKAITTSIDVVVIKKLVFFKSKTGEIEYDIITRAEWGFTFQSKEIKWAKATSICNRERFPYYLKFDLKTCSIMLCHDMSKFKRPDMVVFTGSIENYREY